MERFAAREDESVGSPAGRLEALLRDPVRQLLLSLGGAACIAALSATQLHLNWRASGFESDYARLLVAEGVEWGLWALVVPAIVALDARLEPRLRRRAALAHLGIALLWFTALNLALSLLTRYSDPAAPASLATVYVDRALMRLPSALAVYFFIVAAIWLARSLVRQERLRRSMLEAQLRSLRAQIQPHFLFNSLHTAASLVRSGDRDAAVRTIVGLSDLLRRSLRHGDRDEVPLAQEVAFLETYLDIQRARFGDRLRVDVTIDPGLDGARVPFLTLQPLVENAIRHGLDLDTRPGRLAVRAERRDDRLRIGVLDSGSSQADGDGGLGIGLDNVRSRLEALYGTRHTFRLERRDGGGTRVRIEIPLGQADAD